MSVKKNIKRFKKNIPEHVSVVAVSKTKPVEDILMAYHSGQRLFGENKVQEIITKQPLLPSDIQWHFIGHLQTNKVKYLAPFVSMIESVDSLKLLRETNKQSAKYNRNIDCLLQFHIASEETKFGLSMKEAEIILDSEEFLSFKNITIAGVMGMATFTDDVTLIKKEFGHLKELFQRLKKRCFINNEDFKEISMGMSNDYEIAINEGSTIIRIGSAIFGERG